MEFEKKELTVNFDVIRMNHRDEFVEGGIDLFTPGVNPQSYCSSLGDAAEIVWLLLSVLGVPAHVVLVGQDACSHGGSVVSAQSHEHHAQLGNAGVRFEDHSVGSGDCRVATITANREDISFSVRVLIKL